MSVRTYVVEGELRSSEAFREEIGRLITQHKREITLELTERLDELAKRRGMNEHTEPFTFILHGIHTDPFSVDVQEVIQTPKSANGRWMTIYAGDDPVTVTSIEE